MIVGCYTLDLYCENEGTYNVWGEDGRELYDEYGHQHNEFPHTFADEYGSKCRSEARAKGWLLGRGKALCPKCSGKGK